jgi:hypothetical protein
MRRAWMKVNCLTAIGAATIGWLWFIGWVGIQMIQYSKFGIGKPAANLRRELGEVVPYILLPLSLGFGGRRGCFLPCEPLGFQTLAVL